MAAPAFVKAGTGVTIASGSGACTLAGTTAGNIIILQVLRDGTASAVTLSAITNAENLAGTDNALTDLALLQPVGSPTAAAQSLYIGRSLGGTVSVTVATAGDDLYYRLYEFTGISTATTLAAVTENIANGVGTGTTVSDTGVTTTGADRLALQFVAINDDSAIGSFISMTGGTWYEPVPEFASATGTDGCIQLQVGVVPELNYTAAGGTNHGIGNTAARIRLAQPFTAPRTETVGAIILPVNPAGSPADAVTVRIETDAGGAPSGTLVGTQVTLSPSISWNVFVVPVQAPVTASTKYWIVLARTGAVDAVNYFIWAEATSSYSSHQAFIYNGTSWAVDASVASTQTRRFALASPIASSGTIDGGTYPISTAGWGVIGFALQPVPAVSGTNWTQPVDDTLALADSAATASGKATTIGDTLTLADTFASQAVLARTITDPVALADATAFQRDVALPLADTLALADLVAAQRGIAQAVADTLALADLATTAAGKGVTLADTLALADAATSQAAFARAVADTLSLADTLAAQSAFQLSIVDTLTLADALSSQAAFARALADTLTLADLVDPVKGVGGVAHTQPIADTLALADALTAGSTLARAIADTLALADSVAAQKAILRDLADTVSLADALRFGRALGLTDTVALADAVSFQAAYLRTLADTVTFTDSATASRVLTQAVADLFSLADSLTFTAGRGLLLEDTLTLADLLTLIQTTPIGGPPLADGHFSFTGRGRITQSATGEYTGRGHRGRITTSSSRSLAQTTKGTS